MYNFDEIANRLDTASYKWENKDILPLWVADMDFITPSFITKPIIERINKGAFGYTYIKDEYFIAYKDFYKRRHNINLDIKNMQFVTGVVPLISSLVRGITNIGDNVLVLSPCYNIFYNSIRNNDRIIKTSNLIFKDYKYEIDFLDLELKLKDPKTSLLIISNPMNPIGRLIKEEELIKILELCKKYNVILLSDEIHAEIVRPNLKYNSVLKIIDSYKENVIVAISASKCFNMAGLNGAISYCVSSILNERIRKSINKDEVAEPNAFVQDTFISALNNGDLWLDEMNQYVYNNKLYVKEFIEKNIPEFKYIISDSLYLCWVYINNINSIEFLKFLEEEYKVKFSDGYEYGNNSLNFIRINVATSKLNVVEAMKRLKEGYIKYKNISHT